MMKNAGDIDPNQNATSVATPTNTIGDSDNNASNIDCGQINNTCDECGGSGKTIASPQHTARCKSRFIGRIVVPRADDCRACQPSPAAAVSSDDDIDDDSISENDSSDSSDSDYVDDDDDENAIEMPSKKRMRIEHEYDCFEQ